jgi:hypothetical protein
MYMAERVSLDIKVLFLVTHSSTKQLSRIRNLMSRSTGHRRARRHITGQSGMSRNHMPTAYMAKRRDTTQN